MTLAVRLGDDRTRALYVLLLGLAAVALVGVALTTVVVGPARAGVRRAGRAAPPGSCRPARVGPGLIPVLQLTGVSELLYGLGLLVGLAIAS